MVSFVETGLAALQTSEMVATIIKAFADDGRFARIRSSNMQLSAAAELLEQLVVHDDIEIVVPDGDELETHDEEPSINTDIGKDIAIDSDDSDSDSSSV